MPDTLHEVYNDTVSLKDLANGNSVDVITAEANVTYIIEDLSLNYAGDTFDIELSINNHKVGIFNDNASGSEIVGVNSVVSLSNPAAFTDIHYQFLMDATTTSGNVGNLTAPTLTGYSAATETGVEFSLNGSVTDNIYLMVVMDDAQQYITCSHWDGNNTHDITKYNATTGAQVQGPGLASYTGLAVYGGDDYIYWMYSDTLRRMRIDDSNGQETFASGIAGYGSSTYPMFGTNTQTSPDGQRVTINAPHSGNQNVYANYLDDTTGAVNSAVNIGNSGNGFWTSWTGGSYAIPFYSEKKSSWMVIFISSISIRIAILPTVNATASKIAETTDFGGLAQVSVVDGRIFVSDKTTGDMTELDLDLSVVGKVVEGDASIKRLYRHQRPILKLASPTQVQLDARSYNIPSVSVRITGVKSEEPVAPVEEA